MARYSAEPAPFNHVTDAAPEYVDVILWHRVILVLGALVIALAGMGYGLFQYMNTDATETDSVLAVNDITEQAPPGAVQQTAEPASITQQSAPATPTETLTPAARTQPVTASASVASASAPSKAAASTAVASTTIASTTIASTAVASNVATPQKTITTPSTQAGADSGHSVHTTILMPAVKRALITDSIKGREPGQSVTSTASLSRRDAFTLHMFIDIQGYAGDTLTWKWKHNGKPSTTTRVRVGTNTWRGHASKHFNPKLNGDWQVEVTDQRDILLARSEFHLGQ